MEQMCKFPDGFPAITSFYVKLNAGGRGPLYWTQAPQPHQGETREHYQRRLVYDRGLRFGVKEAEEISLDFCDYHNRKGEESGQDYVVLAWSSSSHIIPETAV